MKLNVSFTLRFKTTIAALEFEAERECDDIEAAKNAIADMRAARQGVEFAAALMYISLDNAEGGCYLLDDQSENILAAHLVQELKLGAEHYYNEVAGSYDNMTNRVTPADFGVLFPDGTIRVVWDREQAALDFETSVAIIKGAAEVLVQAQDLPYCQQTEDEEDEFDAEPVTERRIELLFAAGLWPAADDTFNPVSAAQVQKLLAQYAKKAVSVSAVA